MNRSVLYVLVLLAAAVPALAEVSVNASGKLMVLVKENKVWTPVRKGVDARYFLNPMGDLRSDLPPQGAVSPYDGASEVVYPRHGSSGYDLAFARWDGLEWRQVVLETPGNDLVPRLLHDGWGNRVLLWESEGTIRTSAAPADSLVFTASRHLGEREEGSSEPRLTLTDEQDFLAVWAEEEKLGFRLPVTRLELTRDPAGILLGGVDGPIPFDEGSLMIRLTPGIAWPESGLQPEARSEEGRMWLTWIHPLESDGSGGQGHGGKNQKSAGRFSPDDRFRSPHALGFSVHDGARFGTVRKIPLRGLTEHELESAREKVRRIVLGD